MNPNPQDKRAIEYFAVPPAIFQKIVNKLAEMPYNQVAGLLGELTASSRAMFDKLPPAPKFAGRGGQVVTDPPGAAIPPVDPPASETGNGVDQPGDAIEPTENKRPGFTRHDEKDPRPGIVQEFDASEDCWWTKDTDNIDKPDTGGAK